MKETFEIEITPAESRSQSLSGVAIKISGDTWDNLEHKESVQKSPASCEQNNFQDQNLSALQILAYHTLYWFACRNYNH